MTHTIHSEQEQALENIPMLPSVLLELMALSSDDDEYFSKIEHIIERDPALALKVLHLSNSAQQATVKPVTSIKEAVIRLGTSELFNITAMVAVSRVFVPSTPAEKRLWLHSLQVAELTKMMFDMLGEVAIKQSTAYLVGLLHDIGLFVRFEYSQTDFNKVEDLNWLTPEQHIAKELTILRRNHADLGCKVCKHWGVPTPIPQIVYFHHHYIIPPKYEKYKPLIEVVRRLQIADIISELTRFDNAFSKAKLIEIIDKNQALTLWKDNTPLFDEIVEQVEHTLALAQANYENLKL